MTMLNPKPLTPYLDLPLRESKVRSWPRLPGADVIPIRCGSANSVGSVPGQHVHGESDDSCVAFWAY